MTDDLRRILAYENAIDTRTGVIEVASEMYIVPFWTAEMCASVIRAAESVGSFEPLPNDPLPGNDLSLALISPKLFEHVQSDIGSRILPQFQSVWPNIDYRGIRDAFLVKYHREGQTSLKMHHDFAHLSGSVKLNDDCKGTEIVFPRQNFSNKDIPVGSLLLWPSLVTHPHEVLPLVSGTRYGLTIFTEFPGSIEY